MRVGIVFLFVFVCSIASFSARDLPLEEIDALHQIAAHSKDVELRVRAIRALGKIGSRQSIKVLTSIMTEAVQVVIRQDPQYHERMEKARIAALKAMRKIGMNESDADYVSPNMMKVLRADPAERVQAEAALSLGVIGAKASGVMKSRVAESLTWKLNRCPITKNLLAFMLIKGFRQLNVKTNKVLSSLMGAFQRGYLAIVRLEAKSTVKELFPGRIN
jgi:hypothetical protein